MSILKTLVATLSLIIATQTIQAQVTAWKENVNSVFLNLNTSQTIAHITTTATQVGTYVVTFDGNCVSKPGDRIILAASNTPNWGINNGSIGVEAYDIDHHTNTFSHTQVYSDLPAGLHDFYAVAHNAIETDGDGTASVLGNLLVKFIPTTSTTIIANTPIIATNAEVALVQTLGAATINAPEAGKVIVRFDGVCVSSVGDRIVLAVSEDEDFHSNISVEALDADVNRNSFSHTMVYNVPAGSSTFYAVAQRNTHILGNGQASIYGNLVVEYVPNSSTTQSIYHATIDAEDANLRGSAMTLADITINSPVPAKAIVHFDGDAYPGAGDMIVLAASNYNDWESFDGNVAVENAPDQAFAKVFSHTRVYDIAAGGNSTFYALAQNYFKTYGTGIASVYGVLTVEIIATNNALSIKDVENTTIAVNQNIDGTITWNNANAITNLSQLQLLDITGKLVHSTPIQGLQQGNIEMNNLSNGVYFVQFLTTQKQITATFKVVK